jgi:hypothetical protein
VEIAAVMNANKEVVRESDTQVRVYGFDVALSGLLDSTQSGNIKIEVDPDALRNAATIAGSTGFSAQVGVATVATAKLEITSGAAELVNSGTRFVITLDGNAFKTSGLEIGTVLAGSGLTNSGNNLLSNTGTKGIQLQVGSVSILADSGLGIHAVDAVASDAGQSKVTFEIRGDLDTILSLGELKITIDHELLVGNGDDTNIVVLTGAKAVGITTEPKLTFAHVEPTE